MKIELNLKERSIGDWCISKFHVNREEAKAFNITEMFNGRRRYIEEGTYWKLSCKGECVMSNTPAEIEDHRRFIEQATGSILIAGLGLGMVLTALLQKEDVTRIVVIEKNREVIDLVGEFYQDPRIEIINSDIYQYKPSEHFDFAWFDIWNNISADTYPEMKKLHLMFRRYVSKSDSWCKKHAHRLYKEDAEYEWNTQNILGGLPKHLANIQLSFVLFVLLNII